MKSLLSDVKIILKEMHYKTGVILYIMGGFTKPDGQLAKAK